MNINDLLDSSSITPEWEDFYIDGKKIKQDLQDLKTKNDIITNAAADLRLSVNWGISLLESKNGETAILIAKSFESSMIKELNKVSFFYVENIEYYLFRLDKIKHQLKFNELQDNQNSSYEKAERQLELAIKELYKELGLLKNFLTVNFSIETILINKFLSYSKNVFGEELKSNIIKAIKSHSLDSIVNLDIAGKVQLETERIFARYFYKKYNKESNKIINDYALSSGSASSKLEMFSFGVFVGIMIMILIVILLISSHFNIKVDSDLEYFLLFPIFRGVLLICTYMWLWALNVYAFNKFGINYKLVFMFDDHYTDLTKQLRRASALTTIVLLSMLYYFLIRTKVSEIFEVFNIIPIKFTPLIGWFVFFGYMFFPSTHYCNYRGRKWFLRMIKYSVELREYMPSYWFMSQFSSMAGALRDLAYTICYYYHFNDNPLDISKACDERGFLILTFSLLPFIIRMVHTAKLAYNQKAVYPQFIVSLRYFFSMLATFLSSVMLMIDIKYLIYWLTAVVFSTLFSFYFDLKMDWGFLDKTSPNYPLRHKLCFKNKYFYYSCIVINFFGRIVWVLIINPQVIYMLMRPQFVLTIFFFVELIRKAFWNFIYVENKHILLCSTFRATVFIPLPYTKLEDGEYVLKAENKTDVDKIKERINKIKESNEIQERKLKEEFYNKLISISKSKLKDYVI